jgi:hypothetical protein
MKNLQKKRSLNLQLRRGRENRKASNKPSKSNNSKNNSIKTLTRVYWTGISGSMGVFV